MTKPYTMKILASCCVLACCGSPPDNRGVGSKHEASSVPESREVVIPTSYIEQEIAVALLGTRIQLSNTSRGEVRRIHETRRSCEYQVTDEVRQCQEACIDGDLSYGVCMTSCRRYGETSCTQVTGDFDEWSYVVWSAAMHGLAPNIGDQSLGIPLFGHGGDWCWVDNLTFALDTGNVTLSPYGPYSFNLVLSGTDSRPAIICMGAPNVNINQPRITITLGISTFAGELRIIPHGSFTPESVELDSFWGWLLDWIFDITDQLINGASTQINHLLTTEATRGLNVVGQRLVAQYISRFDGHDLSRIEYVTVLPSGLYVRYEPVGACTPRTCFTSECGTVDVGCGFYADCGYCSGPDWCGGGGIPGFCGHPTDPQTCCDSCGCHSCDGPPCPL